jgi:hypothetical protein
LRAATFGQQLLPTTTAWGFNLHTGDPSSKETGIVWGNTFCLVSTRKVGAPFFSASSVYIYKLNGGFKQSKSVNGIYIYTHPT